MLNFEGKRATIGSVAAFVAALLGAATGTASATSDPILLDRGDSRCANVNNICVFESERFTGQVALYQNVDTECVTVPFGVLAAANSTTKPVTFYKGDNCTGVAITEPAGNMHSWLSFGAVYSFRQR